jgi:hypothetical protein
VERQQLVMYEMLKSLGFSAGIDKKALRDAIKPCFQPIDDRHVYYLLSKTKLGLKVANKVKCFEAIKEFYIKIYKNKKGKQLIEFLCGIEILEIVFDFNQTHVADMDPTMDASTNGSTYINTGLIMIGAGRKKKLKGAMKLWV